MTTESDEENAPLPVPEGLGERGTAFWERTTAGVEFSTEAEGELLLEACRALDIIEGLTEAITKHGLMTVGSTGQLTVNPAIAERRQQSAAFERIIRAMPDPDSEQKHDDFLHKRAKAGAAARWLRAVP